MVWCTRLSELKDFIAFVVLYGPDDFPAWRNMDITKAFSQMHEGVDACKNEIGNGAKCDQIENLFLSAEAAYNNGDSITGAHVLQDIMALL